MTHLLLIKCTDETGLIYKITGVIFKYSLNIISNSEFVEKSSNQFFMRTEISGGFDKDLLSAELHQVLPAGSEINWSDGSKKDIVILATKEHHCLSDLLIRHAFGELQATICCVISNYDTLRSLTEKFNIPFYHVSHEGLTRQEHEAAILEKLKLYKPQFVVLAKFMRILSAPFVAVYPNRIINIHHSFLPAFIGANPYLQAYERGVKIIGATAHFVSSDLDDGPIISQSVIPVNHTQSAKDMGQAGRDVEKTVLSNALRLVFNEQVFVWGNRTIIFN